MQAGNYMATVTEAAMGRASTGTEQLAITFQPDRPLGCAEVQRVTAYLFFTEKTLEKTEKSLRALGWDPTTEAWDLYRAIEGQELVGRRARIVVEEERDQKGEMRLRVAWINDPEGGAALKDPMTSADLRDFSKSLQARMRAAGKASGAPIQRAAPAKQAAPASGPPMDEDDIPF